MGIRDSLARWTRTSTMDAGSGDSTHRQAAAAQEAVQLARTGTCCGSPRRTWWSRSTSRPSPA